jgi:hypothetical protein
MHRRQLEIVQPCSNDWQQMHGTNMVRHCKSCAKSVYDLSMLTEREAKAALDVRPEDVCIRYDVDAQGQIVFYAEARSFGLQSLARPTLAAALTLSAMTANPTPNRARTRNPAAGGRARSGRSTEEGGDQRAESAQEATRATHGSRGRRRDHRRGRESPGHRQLRSDLGRSAVRSWRTVYAWHG